MYIFVLNLKLVVLQVIKILKKINKFINSKSVILYSIFGFFEKKTLLPLPRILIDIWVYKYSLLTNGALLDQASETCSTDPSTDKRTDVWSRPSCIYTQIFSPKKTGFPPMKNTFQIFFDFCLPLFYLTFQCGP